MHKYTEKFKVTSPIGLHGRPSVKIAKLINEGVYEGHINEAEIKNGHRIYVGRDRLLELDALSKMGMECGTEIEISITTDNDAYKDELFRGINDALGKRYFKKEDKAKRLKLVSSN